MLEREQRKKSERKKKEKEREKDREAFFGRSINHRGAPFSFSFATSSLSLNLRPPTVLSSTQYKTNRCTFVVEGYTYNYVVDGSFTFLAVSAER